MARVPDAPTHGEVADALRARRPHGVLRPIDLVLLHSPRLASGWNQLLGSLRGSTALPADLRELVVLRIAALNQAAYEWTSHERDAAEAGLTADQLAALRTPAPEAGEFTVLQTQVLQLTDVMTQQVSVPDPLFDSLLGRLGVEQMVELVLTVAAYNMVSRLVVAMDVRETQGAA